MAALDLILAAVCILVPLGVLALIAIGIFNRMVSLKNRVDNAWAQIDVQLKRRYDLIPNLVETVKGYAKHEKEVLENVTKYRSMITSGGAEQRAAADNMLTSTLKSVFALAESYPQLKADANFRMLQEELAGTENKISYIRTAYNDAVLEFNTAIAMFPQNVIAPMLGFKAAEYFKAAETEKIAPKVQF
ncbi:LemA family protein [Candidatus Micrarchaeota archaeon]|nr:LemA family protein [Candidatus Micrarchaeota archaeon]